MTYKAYLENIKAKTGLGPEDFKRMAKKRGLEKHAELLSWLKNECGLGHGHANAMIMYIRHTAIAKKKIAEESGKKSSR